MLSLLLDGAAPPPTPLPASESSSGLLLNASAQSDGKRIAVAHEEEPEPDGGDVIGRRAMMLPPPVPLSQGSKEDSERAVEGIMTAFRLGRALKEPLPLPLVVSDFVRL